MSGPRRADGTTGRYYGLYPALVTKLVDPESLGRVEVEFPWLGEAGAEVRAWATMLSPYADDDQGLQMLPEPGSQVVVGFEAGDLQRPYVVGAAWNGREALPVDPSEDNNLRLIQTRSGSRLEFDDTEGAVKVRLSAAGDADGSVHKIVMDDASGEIAITASSGAYIKITPGGGIEIQANTTIDVTGSLMTVDVPMAQFNGTITCDTLIAKGGGIVSPTYTPGAGNVW